MSLKNSLKKAVVVMTIMVLSVSTFLPAFAQTTGGGLINPGDSPSRITDATGGQSSFRELAKIFLDFFLGFLGFIAVVMIIYGGILYVTAAGEQDKVDKGKKIIMYAIVGIVIILLSYAIVSTVLGGLGAGSDQ